MKVRVFDIAQPDRGEFIIDARTVVMHGNYEIERALTDDCKYKDDTCELTWIDSEEMERLREALIEIRNDDDNTREPYYFWSLANKALQKSSDTAGGGNE